VRARARARVLIQINFAENKTRIKTE